MLHETRVNLKHLLEDMRDSYIAPLEEVIITEMIANALDSRATRIQFIVDAERNFLRCVDNGGGMKRPQLKEYHNIAASVKQKGQGIGFAGVGAKLSLLLAERVITESKGGYGSRASTEWRLTNPYRAPWKFIPTSDTIQTSRGTAITIFFTDPQSHLIRPDFVKRTVVKHFYPLFHDTLREQIVRYVYKKPIEFVVNGELLLIPEGEQRTDRDFKIYIGRGKRPIGAGFLIKNALKQEWLLRFAGKSPSENALLHGLSVSTYGKIIKSGWEWLGILPKHHELLYGIVEVPALAALLTTNKNDFLTDSAHLKQYYKIRKAIQEAVLPALKSLGAYEEAMSVTPDRNMKPLTRHIESALGRLTNEFPELISVLGHKMRTSSLGKHTPLKDKQRATFPPDAALAKETGIRAHSELERKSKVAEARGDATSKIKKPGLTIVLEELQDERNSLGRIVEDTLSINTLHPAWKRALIHHQEEYHILVTVGLVLSEFLAPDKPPKKFLEHLLTSWGALESKNKTLF